MRKSLLIRSDYTVLMLCLINGLQALLGSYAVSPLLTRGFVHRQQPKLFDQFQILHLGDILELDGQNKPGF